MLFYHPRVIVLYGGWVDERMGWGLGLLLATRRTCSSGVGLGRGRWGTGMRVLVTSLGCIISLCSFFVFCVRTYIAGIYIWWSHCFLLFFFLLWYLLLLRFNVFVSLFFSSLQRRLHYSVSQPLNAVLPPYP